MNDHAVHYRSMAVEDLAAAHALSQAVRWPHRLEDWQLVHRLGSGFAAEVDGALAGTGMCWPQGEQAGSLGMIIVAPEHQGKGIGRRLMELVLEALGARCTMLNATVAGQPLYESLGFQAIGTLHQHQGMLTIAAPLVLAEADTLRAAGPGDLANIIALANRASGMERGALMQALLAEAPGMVLERAGAPVGFSIMRRFGRGQLVGPLVAPDTESAKALVACWADASGFVRLDITGSSTLGEWLAQSGLPQVDTAVIMARNGVPAQDPEVRQFAIISQALC